MQIRNLCTRQLDEFQHLIDFVTSRAGTLPGITLNILDSDVPRAGAGGQCIVKGDRYGRAAVVITIWMAGEERIYPYEHTHVKEIGAVRFSDWQEEFLMVLAHEIRHVEQWLNGSWSKERYHEMEIDADRAALWALEEYRDAQRLAA